MTQFPIQIFLTYCLIETQLSTLSKIDYNYTGCEHALMNEISLGSLCNYLFLNATERHNNKF